MDWGWDVICVGRGLSESGFAGFSRIFRIVGGGGGGTGLATAGQFKVHGMASRWFSSVGWMDAVFPSYGLMIGPN